MKDEHIELSQLLGTYKSAGKKIKIVTILGEFVGVICSIGGSSTQSGKGGINDIFQIRNDNDDISDHINLVHVLSIEEI